MAAHVLAIDQGTTSTRAIVFDAAGQPVATAQREFAQHYPADGWVEHDVEDIWRDTVAVCREAVAQAGLEASGIAAIGIAKAHIVSMRPVENDLLFVALVTGDQCYLRYGRRKDRDAVFAAFQKTHCLS